MVVLIVIFNGSLSSGPKLILHGSLYDDITIFLAAVLVYHGVADNIYRPSSIGG